jgi:L-gulonate 3-dehydrogenase
VDSPSEVRKAVTIIGAGSIGLSFAIAFARGGWDVVVVEPAPAALAIAPSVVKGKVEAAGEGSETDQSPEWLQNIGYGSDFAASASAASLVLECAPERLDLKRSIFSRLDDAAGPKTILASASSALMISEIAGHINGRHRAILAHPANPPHIIPMVEVVPADFTSEDATGLARDFFSSIGMAPVVLGREISGLAMNRLQGALLREAYFLVRDGVASVEDIDTIVRSALGLRWAVAGPFETADLNTRGGIAAHARTLGPAYGRFGRERGEEDPWTPEVVAEVTRQRRALMPLEAWRERVLWREREIGRVRSATMERPS